MKTFKFFLTLFCLLAALHVAADDVKGVSRELAKQRKNYLSNIKYDLTFDIPAGKKQPVSCQSTIYFTCDGSQDLVLDFKGRDIVNNRQYFVNNVKKPVNSKKFPLVWIDEHIYIPKELLVAGENFVTLNTLADDRALNRHDDFLYTLFVPDHARSVFPCFDQPDLKAVFQATVNAPQGWSTMTSDPSNPIPTYLFSFVAGRFSEKQAVRDGRAIRALYREEDPQKVAQLETVIDDMAYAVKWMEGYTGIAMPFSQLGFVVLPGYQFGGMEHPGAIQLNEHTIFLGQNPTQEELLNRLKLISHEVAHLWFGDLVTMQWFDDVWTKEVFANFMAAKISERRFRKVNHELSFLKTYQVPAMQTDRTEGSHPILQDLNNLNHASLLYGNIVYDKAPVVMRMMEELLGVQAFQRGLQKYLERYAYSNATWDQLIDVLNDEYPGKNLLAFSDVWVREKGMPIIHTTWQDGKLIVRQTDPYGRQMVWMQKFDVLLGYDLDPSRTVQIKMDKPEVTVSVPRQPSFIIPNFSGKGYGRFTTDKYWLEIMAKRLMVTRNDLGRLNLALTLRENYLMRHIGPSYFGELFRALEKEKNPLIMQTLVNHMWCIAFNEKPAPRKTLELCMMDVLDANHSPECRQYVYRALLSTATAPELLQKFYNIWQTQSEPLLDERDYTNMAYHLAIMMPDRWQSILKTQRARIKNADRLREFDFVSRACTPNQQEQRKLFNSLLQKENQVVEPWATGMLRLLSCNAREPQNNYMIKPALEALEDIQKTGDIFVPRNWLDALLSGHKTPEARQAVGSFIDSHPNYPEPLRNKLMEASFRLMNGR